MSKTKQIAPNAIEKVMETLETKKVRQLTEEELHLTLVLATQREKNDEVFDKILESKSNWILKALKKRAEHCLDVKITKGALLFIYGVSDRIGIGILYLYYLQYWAKKHNVKEINFHTVATRIFPFGVHTEESLKEAWDAQKRIPESYGETDNLIDVAEASKSIMLAS